MFKRKTKDGQITVSTEKCIGCGHCVQKCRHGAMGLIQLKKDSYAMVINPSNCTKCGKCLRICTFKAIQLEEPANYLDALVEFL